ncbi:class I SAM-dependent methyltransferase [Dictyobacter arantiisoli]|uniref:Methyltransferase domain-containing protein n=1 Tax=Dictyobacter arantiisoli TaxID=2014874 RepID=A0A5A5TFS3_9CHLR|nr:class I SAM-dependent methyltransferase [Dictyobacter arantiisoli]GCF09996.1 hypothetical protein KDI_35600 [Dictyobacter arantiisoli]
MSASEHSFEDGGYVIDVEEVAETVRLVEQDRLMTQSMGGLLAEQPEVLLHAENVLDIGCGPGEWAIEIAHQHPNIGVIGIDINQMMITHAFTSARGRGIENVTFELMDALAPLNFQDASFDLVNARTILAFMNTTTWPPLLQECRRILKPGGILRLSEIEVTITNSSALQRLNGMISQAMARQKRSFSVDGQTYGIGYILPSLLKQAGYVDVERCSFILDTEYSSATYQGLLRDTELTYRLIKPYLLKSHDISEAEYETLFLQMQIEMRSEDFICCSFGLTAWGKTPV